MNIELLYQHLPLPLQDLACSLEGWRIQRSRYAEGFWTELKNTEIRGKMDYAQVCAFRDHRLHEFVKHAVETTPYYRGLFSKLGLSPNDIRSLKDMRVLPVLTKAQVQDAPSMFASSAIPRKSHIAAHTSGTTGGGLRFATTAQALQVQWATWWRYWRWHGIQPGTWCGYFGGRSVVPVRQKFPPYWRINYPGRQILFSAYHMNPGNLGHYMDELRNRRPPWLHGYPSQLALIASHMIDTGYDLGYQPQWVTVGAENLLPHQVTAIAAAFGRHPLQHYGMAEAVANISQCESGALHVDEDFAGVEFLDSELGGPQRIVGTNFSNPATPLLRYEVGDHAELSPQFCRCGRPGRIVRSLDGRLEDYVIKSDGTKIGRLDHIFKDLVNIREAQIRQSYPGRITVFIVKNSAYGVSDEGTLRREFQSRLGSEMTVEMSYTDRIERTRHGKLRFVVNEMAARSNGPAPA